MIEGTIIKNGTLRVLLEGTDSIDAEVLKKLDGARCRIVNDNHRMGDKLMTGCLIIELERDAKTEDRPEPSAQDVVPDTTAGDRENVLPADREEIDDGAESVSES